MSHRTPPSTRPASSTRSRRRQTTLWHRHGNIIRLPPATRRHIQTVRKPAGSRQLQSNMGAHRGGRKHAKRPNPSPTPMDHKKQKQQGRQRSAPPSPMPTESDCISSDSFVSSSASSQSSRSTSPTPPPQTIQKERIPPIIVDPTHWASVAPMIMPSFTQDKLTAKFSQNNIKLQAVDTTTFRSVQAVLKNTNIYPSIPSHFRQNASSKYCSGASQATTPRIP